jgi:hypothetical protein
MSINNMQINNMQLLNVHISKGKIHNKNIKGEKE